MDNKLQDARVRIDHIDDQLMRLFEERMEVVGDVARYKEEHGLPIFQRQREEEVIKKNVGRIGNKGFESYAEEMLQALMDISKAYQCTQIGLREVPLSKGTHIKVGFQGVPGSFSEEALIAYFGEEYSTNHYQAFHDVFEALKYKEIDYGILPIENSTTGSITPVYDLLKKYGFYIVGETKIKIQQHLIGHEQTNLKEIKEIYSHEQGFEQSSDYLKLMPGVKQIPYYNTAISAKYVSDSKDTTKAAIGSKRAAKLYGLHVLAEAINNSKENYTRFAIIGTKKESNALCDKMTLMFTVANEAGTLYQQLRLFSEAGINLIKIESRPVGDGSFSYFFYIDIEGNVEDEKIQQTLQQIAASTQEFRMLGCYKKNS
ncbi:MAG: prephenate dehydratase [Cellulosilyticaceae bacterium]